MFLKRGFIIKFTFIFCVSSPNNAFQNESIDIIYLIKYNKLYFALPCYEYLDDDLSGKYEEYLKEKLC